MNHSRIRIADVPISELSMLDALEQVEKWSEEKCGAKQVAFCNVHVLCASLWDPRLREALLAADLILPDGAPIAWLMRRMGLKKQSRVAGPDFMLRQIERSAELLKPIFLMGSSETNLRSLKERLLDAFPSLTIAGSFSPFRPLSDTENREIISMIKKSGAKTLWIGLGCPKQEIWIHENGHEVPAVFLGVGAAFDFLSGAKPRAPAWMQQLGLEWLFRLSTDPTRLLPRYLVTNTVFVWIVFNELVLKPLVWKSRTNRKADPLE